MNISLAVEDKAIKDALLATHKELADDAISDFVSGESGIRQQS